MFPSLLLHLESVIIEEILDLTVDSGTDLYLLHLGTLCPYTQFHHPVDDLNDTEVLRSGDDVRFSLCDLRQFVLQDVFHIAEILIERNGDLDDEVGILTGLIDDVGEIAVIDGFDILGKADDPRRTDTDLDDSSGETADFDDIAYLEFPFKDDEETGQDIGDEVLGTQTYEDCDESGRGQKGLGIHTEEGQTVVEREEDRHVVDGTLQKAETRLIARTDDGDQGIHDAVDDDHGQDVDRYRDQDDGQ